MVHRLGGFDELRVGGICGQGIGGKTLARLLLFFEVCHCQRDPQLPAARAVQPDAQQHQRHQHRDDGKQLAGAQPGAADEQRIGAQTLDPRAPQAIPCGIAEENLPVEFAVLDQCCQQRKADQTPDALI